MIQLAILLFTISYAVDAYAIGMTIATAVLAGTLYAAAIPALAFAINLAVSFVISKVLTPSNSSSGSADQGVRLQVPPDPTRNIPIVYGDVYIGGKFIDAALTTDGSTMYYVMAISSISDDGQFIFNKTKFYYGDRLCTFDSTSSDTFERARVLGLTDGAGNVDTKISGKLYIHLFKSNSAGVITNLDVDGVSAGAATPQNLMSTANGIPAGQEWTASGRQMNGLAFAIIKLVYNRDAETTQLQPVTFFAQHHLKGTGVAKPGDVWYDYMTNPIYGAAVDPAFVDASAATALNAYSDQTITFRNQAGVLTTQPRYRINGVLDTNQNILQNVDQIMTACDSWMTYQETSGKWSVVVNKAETSSFSFDDSNIIGAITVGGMDITTSINQIEARFPDGTNRDQFNYVYIETPSGILYPNEPVNKSNLNYDLVNNSVQAYYLANRLLEQAREDLNITINTTYVGIQVNAGDVVSMTNAYYGWTNKLFRVMQVREASLPDGNLGAQIQMAEYNVQVYDNFDITQFTPEPNSGLVAAGYFSALTAPIVVNINASASVPSFGVQVTIPTTGRVTNLTLFYTTVATPTVNDWQILDSQSLINSQPFVNGSTFVFTDLSLPTGAYYFVYKAGNNVSQSTFSPLSALFNWNPLIIGADTFIANFDPPNFLVPYDTTPTFTGIIAKLYGNNASGAVEFIPAQTDSDVAFVNNSWRIGGSATTGYGDIVKSGITIGNPIDIGTFAEFPLPTAMPSNPATMTVPVRFKDSLGTVYQVNPATVQFAWAEKGATGATGQKTATVFLYQWSTVTPPNPTGTSTYTWATGANTGYTGGNGWSTVVPNNPGVPLILLWTASKQLVVSGTTTTTTVDWTTSVTVASVGQNGAAGVQTAQPTVFQWAVSIPTGPTGTSTYTWSSGTFTPTPSGWSLTPPASPSPGFTLWGATVSLLASATQTTSSINWTTASITARGYSGTNGATGTTGASARICYSKTTLSSLASSPATITTTGNTSFPPNGSWGGDTVWQATPPAIVAGESVYQSDGIYNPATNQTIWNVPYLSALKVGSLSAITANLGTVTAGSINGLTITGGTIQTSASGKRLSMTGSDNFLRAFNSTNDIVAEFGGSSGILYANSRFGGFTLLAPTIAGYGLYEGGNFPSGADIPVILGANTKGNGVEGSSETNGVGLFGVALRTGGTNHGLRAINKALNGGTSTSGLVGASNGYDFYADGAGVNYGPFTGTHDVMVATGVNIPEGYIVVDVRCLVKKNMSNTIFEVAMSSEPNQVPIGVFVLNNGLLANQIPAGFIDYIDYSEDDPHMVLFPEYDLYKDDFDYCAANAVGEGQVYVCNENGDIEAGDLIVTSSMQGVGMKQSDNIVRSITVAKAREAVSFSSSTEVKLVACIYLCG